MLIDLFDRLYLFSGQTRMPRLIGGFDMDKNKVQVVESLDGVFALCPVISIKISGGSRNGNNFPTETFAEAVQKIHGRNHTTPDTELLYKFLEFRCRPASPN